MVHCCEKTIVFWIHGDVGADFYLLGYCSLGSAARGRLS